MSCTAITYYFGISIGLCVRFIGTDDRMVFVHGLKTHFALDFGWSKLVAESSKPGRQSQSTTVQLQVSDRDR